MYAVELLQPAYLQDRAAERAAERAAAAINGLSQQLNEQNAAKMAASQLSAVQHKPLAHPSAMTQVLKQRPIPVRGHSGVFENIFHGFKSVAAASHASPAPTPCAGTPLEKSEADAMMADRKRDIDLLSVPTLMRPW